MQSRDPAFGLVGNGSPLGLLNLLKTRRGPKDHRLLCREREVGGIDLPEPAVRAKPAELQGWSSAADQHHMCLERQVVDKEGDSSQELFVGQDVEVVEDQKEVPRRHAHRRGGEVHRFLDMLEQRQIGERFLE